MSGYMHPTTDNVPILRVTARIYGLLLAERGPDVILVDVPTRPGYLTKGFYADARRDLIIAQATPGFTPCHWVANAGYC
jgi:hypothetical protein